MKRTYIRDVQNNIGSTITLKCWVDVARDQSKLIFFDFRDMTGKVQGIAKLEDVENLDIFKEVKKESTVEVIGLVKERPDNNKKKEVLNGDVELQVKEIKILNLADTPPIDVDTDGRNIDEEVRYEYRYIDLRRPRLQKNIIQRSKASQFIRLFLAKEEFVEIETPCLTRTTPEGARDYIVPSRAEPGYFYALPQSPQQYKQLLMCGGFEKYFQIARCFRDEDSRGDRQPEFTQIDIEMSFVSQEEIMELNEKMMIEMVKELYPDKIIQETPFPRISYKEAMKKYNSDHPDVRKNPIDSNVLAFCWVIDFPFFEKDNNNWTFTHNPFSAPQEKYEDNLMKDENIKNILASQYDLVLNGFEVMGGSIRTHKPEVLRRIFSILGFSNERMEKEFGHILKALSYGTPPHGGAAYGFDRLMMILQNEETIAEVIAFPKTRTGREIMVKSPSKVSLEQLQVLGLSVNKKKEE